MTDDDRKDFCGWCLERIAGPYTPCSEADEVAIRPYYYSGNAREVCKRDIPKHISV